MRTYLLLVALLGSAFAAVSFDIQRHYRQHARLVRRDNVVVKLINEDYIYMTNLLIGTPGQNISAVIDTGSSDLWMSSIDNPKCGTVAESGETFNCNPDGGYVFDTSASSTWNAKTNFPPFNITYLDGSVALGQFGEDTLTLGSGTLKSATFAVANQTNSAINVFGIGLVGAQSTVDTINPDGTLSFTYDNIPISMKKEGLIDTIAYSIWLNDKDAGSGSLLFGGVDHSKYTGDLAVMPMVGLDHTIVTELRVLLDKITFEGGSMGDFEAVDMRYPTLLDTGASFCVMPETMAKALAGSLGGVFLQSQELFVVECSAARYMTFTFSGFEVKVPMEDMLTPLANVRGGGLKFSNGEHACMFNVKISDDMILGDNVLRSLYVVFDLEKYEIGIAMANHNPGDAQVEDIKASGGIPSGSSIENFSASTSTDDFYISVHIPRTTQTHNINLNMASMYPSGSTPSISFHSEPTHHTHSSGASGHHTQSSGASGHHTQSSGASGSGVHTTGTCNPNVNSCDGAGPVAIGWGLAQFAMALGLLL